MGLPRACILLSQRDGKEAISLVDGGRGVSNGAPGDCPMICGRVFCFAIRACKPRGWKYSLFARSKYFVIRTRATAIIPPIAAADVPALIAKANGTGLERHNGQHRSLLGEIPLAGDPREAHNSTCKIGQLQRRRCGFADIQVVHELQAFLWTNTVVLKTWCPFPRERRLDAWSCLWYDNWYLGPGQQHILIAYNGSTQLPLMACWF